MVKKKLVQASNGNFLCHFWRDGEEYYRQKSPIFLKEFNNVCFSVYPQPPHCPYLYRDLTKPLPFEGESFDHVNSYHIFEHLSLKEGHAHTAELFRVMKPGGILRISVPDLESIAREYLEYLGKSLENPVPENLQRYKWCVYELIDQATRTYSGGMMLEDIQKGDFDKEHLLDRYSDVFDPFLNNRSGQERQEGEMSRKSFFQRLRTLTPEKIKRRLRWNEYKVRRERKDREIAGDPRKTKESVRWMHDRLSLRLMVESQGFVDVKRMDFDRSDIPDWQNYNLDSSNYQEKAIDPSVYIECRKPS